MTIPTAAAAAPPAMPTVSSKDSPAKIHEAAQQFESLLIGQLLKTSREAGGGGWMGTDEEDPGATGMEIAEQQFAKMLAANGGLGLSKTIEAGLRAQSK